jgi:hypothetical protein
MIIMSFRFISKALGPKRQNNRALFKKENLSLFIAWGNFGI